MTTPFEDAAAAAHRFMAGLHTMQEIQKTIQEHDYYMEMIERCTKHKDLKPSVKDFQDEAAEIESFWVKVANIYAEMGVLDS